MKRSLDEIEETVLRLYGHVVRIDKVKLISRVKEIAGFAWPTKA